MMSFFMVSPVLASIGDPYRRVSWFRSRAILKGEGRDDGGRSVVRHGAAMMRRRPWPWEISLCEGGILTSQRQACLMRQIGGF